MVVGLIHREGLFSGRDFISTARHQFTFQPKISLKFHFEIFELNREANLNPMFMRASGRFCACKVMVGFLQNRMSPEIIRAGKALQLRQLSVMGANGCNRFSCFGIATNLD